jgi:hypothetical protein
LELPKIFLSSRLPVLSSWSEVVTAPLREESYLVFAQRMDARVDIDAWNDHAVRFFATRVGLAEDVKQDPATGVPTAAVSLVLAPQGAPPGIRSLFARPREAGDLALAEEADANAGSPGLALLARRCESVWLVIREVEPDSLALLGAAILASLMLGPILDVRGPELYGVKTARAKLDAIAGQIIRS